ncbi:glycosyltransferase family 4 protein [Ancylomarina longa]|uniref:Glycosyltransferase family 1 protein n=1 Tax=Ancylomarina longa TaxID=2487017 RepID=A0A434B005_9BACT|nr:glycosyltransferase family 4 protein [Ancylomarina longa]RUT80126.1 glycosyltransferase family 1 protein [Ancylomarina longa]
MNKKIFIVVNVDWFFLSHRLPIALAAIKNGYDVTLITKDSGRRHEIEEMGINFIDMPFERSKFNPINEYLIYRKLRRLYKEERPDIVHHVTLKPMILGGFAVRKFPNISVVNAVSGLGILFSSEGSKLKRFFALQLLRRSFRIDNKLKVIFQNSDDQAILVNNGIVESEQTVFTKGSGVNLDEFSYKPVAKKERVQVLLASRLLYPKGFQEFYLAAKEIKNSYGINNVDFVIAGGLDELNPAAISEETIREWESDGTIKWLGFAKNMQELIAKSDIIVFPSYYGEGIPKFLIESCAIGRPIITTNHPGCKECVVEGENGYLIPPKDYKILAERLEKLILGDVLREQFGKKSRSIAEKDFSVDRVVDEHLKVYKEFLYEAI